MKSLQQRIPFYLVYSRIVSAGLFVPFCFIDFPQRDIVIVALMLAGIVSDFFDGVLARKWGVSSEKLRIWDSNADQMFWLSAIACIFYLNATFLKSNYVAIVWVIGLEALTYLVSYVRFKKPIATHSIMAKVWTASLLFFLIDLSLNHDSSWFYWICIGLGILSRLEILLIIVSLKKWTTDVPSLLDVSKINRNIPIKKNKWFNS